MGIRSFSEDNSPFQVNQKYISQKLIEEIKDSSNLLSDKNHLKKEYKKNGYLFFRNFIPTKSLKKARKEIIQRLESVGEVKIFKNTPIATGRSERRSKEKNLGTYWKSVSEGKNLRLITHSNQLSGLASKIFNETCAPFDFIFLRVGVPGRYTHIHCDYPFFTRMTEEVVTMWIALTDVAADLGPLFLIKGSHLFSEHLSETKGFDLMKQNDRNASIKEHPEEYAKRNNTCLLTKEFMAGDVLLFNMYILHGSFENYSKKRKIRITCDVRFQPKAMPKDPRYFGKHPTGTTGFGYGELNGAKPLDEPWHVR